MKARIKETGEIIKVADYAKIVLDQCDSWGNPIEMKPEDVELIQEPTEDSYWQDVRERAAIAAMQSLIYKSQYCQLFAQSIAVDAIVYADALVEQLKNKVQ